MLSLHELQLPFLLLYAEIHYRFFPLFPSLLFKNEPEILFDVPYRLGPSEDLPILLIINDLKRFMVLPKKVSVTVSHPLSGTFLFMFTDFEKFEIKHPFQTSQRAFIFPISKKDIPIGQIFINAVLEVENSKKTWQILNDNLNMSSKRAMQCYNSDNPLPGNLLCTYGDCHVHSQFSQSHVEFGPPLAVIDIMARSCGLKFVGITDHSYDLSCEMNDYLIEDQFLGRWKCERREFDTVKYSTILIQGEEISCQSDSGATIHLGALGIINMITGSKDGARKNRFFKQQHTIEQAITEIHNQGGIAFAAHPCSPSGVLQRLFLHRGEWIASDFDQPIDGLQIFNNGFSQSWFKGKSLWIKLLNNGKRIPLIAGNDAHGDFNRYRAIRQPFLSIYEDFQRYMGYGKTGIYGNPASSKAILNCLRNGESFITTGPYISINYSENKNDFAVASRTKLIPYGRVYIHAISSPEFGNITKLSVFSGLTNAEASERLFFTTTFSETSYELIVPIEISNLPHEHYLRAEIETKSDSSNRYHAFTNCLFFG